MSTTRTPAALIPCLVLAALVPLGAAEIDPSDEVLRRGWPGFLGPDRNGITDGADLIDAWPEGGPKILWRVPLGTGMSGVAVGRYAVTLAHREGKQTLVALDPKSGEVAREVPIAPIYRNAMGDGPRATPTLDGHVAYVYTGEGILAAVDLSEGAILWKHDVPGENGGKPAEYGMASSPLLHDGHVIVIAGAPAATVVAYEAKTGKLAWKAGDDPCGYSSPTLLEVGGAKRVVAFSGSSVLGIDPESGKLAWRYPFVTDYKCNTATPIAVDGKVLISSGENHGSVLLDVSGAEPEVVWESLGPRSTLRSEWQTPLLVGEHLYNFDNVGSAGAISHFTCVNAKSGERVWQRARFGKGNAVMAGGLVVMTTFDGQFVAAKVSPEGYTELGRMPVLRRTRQSPSVANGLAYVRDDREIVCIDLRK